MSMNSTNREVVTIHADFTKALDSLTALRSCEVKDRQRFAHILQSGLQLFRAKENVRCAPGTTEFTVTLEPSERLLELLAASRTIDAVKK